MKGSGKKGERVCWRECSSRFSAATVSILSLRCFLRDVIAYAHCDCCDCCDCSLHDICTPGRTTGLQGSLLHLHQQGKHAINDGISCNSSVRSHCECERKRFSGQTGLRAAWALRFLPGCRNSDVQVGWPSFSLGSGVLVHRSQQPVSGFLV